MMAGEIMAEKGNDNWIPIYLNRVLNAHQSEKNILYKEMNDTKKGKRVDLLPFTFDKNYIYSFLIF